MKIEVYFILLLRYITAVHGHEKSQDIVISTSFIEQYHRDIGHLMKQMQQQGAVISELKETVSKQEKRIYSLEEITSTQKEIISDLQADVSKQGNEIFRQDHTVKLEHHNKTEREGIKSSLTTRNTKKLSYTGHFTKFGCVSDEITLTCPDGRSIFVTSADYGQYYFPCNEGCCAPHPSRDCRELVSENRPGDWVDIKFLCDNKTSCMYEYDSSVIDECEEGYIADYLQMFYNCLPEPKNQPCGFTAHNNGVKGTQYESSDELVLFQEVVSNIGGHYEPTTSTFQCPYDGAYFFSVGMSTDYGQRAGCNIMLEWTSIVDVYADDIYTNENDPINQASATVVVECNRSEVVWISSYYDSVLYPIPGYTYFAGCLLHRYN